MTAPDKTRQLCNVWKADRTLAAYVEWLEPPNMTTCWMARGWTIGAEVLPLRGRTSGAIRATQPLSVQASLF